MTRRQILTRLGSVGAGLWAFPRMLAAQTRVGMLGRTIPAGVSKPPPPPAGALLFDSFENGLDGVNGAGVNPNWNFVNETNEGASEGTIAIVGTTGGITPIESTHMLQVTTTIQHGPAKDYTTDVDIQPWNVSGTNQGSFYAYERTQGGTYTTGVTRSLEFYMNSNAQYPVPDTNGGANPNTDGCVQVGTYTMELDCKGVCNNQEGGGFHGYHTVRLPYTNGRWMKIKMLIPGGMRQPFNTPAALCRVATTNGTPFIPYETISCSPSGAQLTFTREQSTYPIPGTDCVFGLWRASGVIPSASDTLTGLSSGAVRTISAAEQYITGNYSGGPNIGPAGFWTNYDARWIVQGGCNNKWYSDYPNTAYWDRVTRFYIAAIGNPSVTLPLIDYIDYLAWGSDTRDDLIAQSNLGAYYDPSAGKLYVTWQRNSEFTGNTWDVRVSANDIQTGGWASAAPWHSLTDSGSGYPIMSIYNTLSSPPNPLYVGIQNPAWAAFLGVPTIAQIVIGTV